MASKIWRALVLGLGAGCALTVAGKRWSYAVMQMDNAAGGQVCSVQEWERPTGFLDPAGFATWPS